MIHTDLTGSVWFWRRGLNHVTFTPTSQTGYTAVVEVTSDDCVSKRHLFLRAVKNKEREVFLITGVKMLNFRFLFSDDIINSLTIISLFFQRGQTLPLYIFNRLCKVVSLERQLWQQRRTSVCQCSELLSYFCRLCSDRALKYSFYWPTLLTPSPNKAKYLLQSVNVLSV